MAEVKYLNGPAVHEWLEIAGGRQTLPLEFQRFIAAWEVVVAWSRCVEPNDRSDSGLKRRLEHFLPRLHLETDSEWRFAIEPLLSSTVIEMQGPTPTGRELTLDGPHHWHSIVEMLYMIRCNLLKAGKRPADQNDRKITALAAGATEVIARKLVSTLLPVPDSNGDSNVDRQARTSAASGAR